jgi:AcrR family transcriptional regulator
MKTYNSTGRENVGLETSARILAAAKSLMWKHGIRRVTVDEICREAGVSKMTFYRYFDNKLAVARTVIQNVIDGIWGRVEDIMARPIPFKEKAGLFIELKIEQANALGQEISRELVDDSVPGLTEFVETLRGDLLEKTIALFRRSQEAGDVRRDIKPEFLLYMFNLLTEAARDKNLAGQYPSFQALIKEIMEFIYFGLMPRE